MQLLGKALMGNRVQCLIWITYRKQYPNKLLSSCLITLTLIKLKMCTQKKLKHPEKKTYPRIIQVDVTCVALSLESKLRELFSPTCKYQPHTRRRVSNCKERRWTRVPQRQQKRLKQGETEWWWWQCWWQWCWVLLLLP